MAGVARRPQLQLADRIRAECQGLRARLHMLERAGGLMGPQDSPGGAQRAADLLDDVEASVGKDLALRSRQALLARLRALETAAERIRHGTYGVCRLCGEPIAPRRLKALPEAELCLPCAEAAETPRPFPPGRAGERGVPWPPAA